jgi:tryptophan-rich sensory protein
MNNTNVHLLSAICVASPVLLAFAEMIGLRFLSSPKSKQSAPSASPSNALLPPSAVIATVWSVVLGCLGYALFLGIQSRSVWTVAALVTILVACLAYPLYTAEFTDRRAVVVGNTLTLIAGFLAALVAAVLCPSTLPFIAPLCAWLSYVNVADAVTRVL